MRMMIVATMLKMMMIVTLMVNTDSEKEDESYDSGLDMKPVSNGMMREYDWRSISDSDNESVASPPYH